MKSFRFLNVFVCAVFVAGLASAGYSQKFLSKPYTEWDKDGAMKIANESGWARVFSSTAANSAIDAQNVGRSMRDTANSGGGNPGSVARNLGSQPVVARLHSAVVLRQALVRLQQIGAKYDDMSADEKAKFDASRKGFLDCAICKNYYVITVTKYTDASGESVGDAIFQSLTLDDLKGNVTLVNDKGETRQLFQFTPAKGAGDSSVFFFERNDANGNPLVSSDTKEIDLVFANKFIEQDKRYGGQYPRKFEFSVKKITVGGKVDF